MNEDSELLRRYAEGSESAFATFVQRHVNLVYAAALRRTGHDRQLAEEITQTVFAHCARKAKTLRDHPALGGWLHRSTRFAAIDSLRARQHRLAAEALAAMHAESSPAPETDRTWNEIRPLVDALLDRLGDSERGAIVLRFFEGRSFAEIGARFRISEDAARMRVDRALDKLRLSLARRGVRSTAATLGLALGAWGAPAAPAGLAHAISASALATTTASGGGLALGSLFLMSKTKAAVSGAALALGLTAVVFESRANLDLQRQINALHSPPQRVASSRIAAPAPGTPAAENTDAAELVRLKARIAELKARPDGVVDTEILPRSAWKNAGHATPEASFETLAWATETENYEIVAESYCLGEAVKAQAEAYFAALPPELRTAYRTPERLLAPYIAARPKEFRVEAIQPIEPLVGDRPDEVMLRYWSRVAGGAGRVDTLPFRRIGDQWLMGSREMGLSISDAIEFVRLHVDSRLPAYTGKR